MEADEKWYFTKEQLANTPSRKCGYDADRELSCRQQAANFIQDMGQRLQVTQLCINTAIVYMHRFYVFHSFTQFHRNAMAAAALFLAAKVEEQPRKLEHVIKVAQMCLHRELPTLDTKSEVTNLYAVNPKTWIFWIDDVKHYMEQAQDLVMNENVLLQTLGFDVAIDHPHTHVVRCCHLVKASKDLAQTSYFMASNSLHLTTMCLQYKPTVVACFCIHLACKWSNWEIPLSNESKSWFWYVDRSVTQELLEQLTDEFLRIFDKCPSRLKRKISANQNMTGYHMGVNELNQKSLRPPPGGPGGDHPQGGVSFQQPNRGPRTNEDQRKINEKNMLPPSHNAPRQIGGGAPIDFKKQPVPPPQSHTGSRDASGYGMTGYHGMTSASQLGSHQPSNPQMMHCYPPPSTSFPGATPGLSVNGPNSRLPSPSVPPKHPARGTEAIFHPPKRSGSSSSSSGSHTVTTPSSSFSRPIKTEPMQPPTQQPTKSSHAAHHMPRNGTCHTADTVPQPTIKTEPGLLKYPAMDKHSSHQKGPAKSYDGSRQAVGGGWVNPNDAVRSIVNDMNINPNLKHIKTEVPPVSSYHIQMPAPISVKRETMSPPPPPPPLPPPPPPPPPPPNNPPPVSKPSSIFSPDKMTPPPLNSPKDVKPIIVSPLLLSPISANKSGRNRTSSSSSEPELIPVMPKLEEMSGFESLAKGKTAIKLPHKVPEPTHSSKEKRKEVPSTNNVVKEEKPQNVALVYRPPEVVVGVTETKPAVQTQPVDVTIDLTGSSKREHKKKKKHKEHKEHREHKEHKDKDRDKEKEKKKDKHKDKHREKDKEKEKHTGGPAPIKITIPKDKISKIIPPPPPPVTAPPASEPKSSLKIKIPKDKLIKPHVEPGKTQSSLKIKISKDAISSHSSSKSGSSSSGSSKKRERSSHREDDRHPSKHAKVAKTNGDYRLAE